MVSMQEVRHHSPSLVMSTMAVTRLTNLSSQSASLAPARRCAKTPAAAGTYINRAERTTFN